MNLQEMLNNALEKIEVMSVEEFEKECIQAGYTPVRKQVFSMSKIQLIPNEELVCKATHCKSIVVESFKSDDFGYQASDEYSYQLAA